jgi:LytR cell envelope-related transcriptional attenuator
VDHYAPAPDLAAPWRTRTLIATAVAALELLALMALAVALVGKGWFEHARASAAADRPAARAQAHARDTAAASTKRETAAATSAPTHRVAAPARPVLARAHTGIVVLNGNGQNGAAGAEARVLRARGYPVVSVGNARRNDYATTIVMYRPGYGREAQRLARDVGVRVVSPLDGVRPSQLKSARLMLIVGR